MKLVGNWQIIGFYSGKAGAKWCVERQTRLSFLNTTLTQPRTTLVDKGHERQSARGQAVRTKQRRKRTVVSPEIKDRAWQRLPRFRRSASMNTAHAKDLGSAVIPSTGYVAKHKGRDRRSAQKGEARVELR